jgi:hypothetical protein
MKKISTLLTILNFLVISSAAYAVEKIDKSCDDPSSYDLAYKANQEFNNILENVPGAINIEIETCNEFESYAISAGKLQCGVSVWFSDEKLRDEFHQKSREWQGKLKLADGSLAPVCSRVSLQLMSKGPY